MLGINIWVSWYIIDVEILRRSVEIHKNGENIRVLECLRLKMLAIN